MSAPAQGLTPQAYPSVPDDARAVLTGAARLEHGNLVESFAARLEDVPAGPVHDALERLVALSDRRRRAQERMAEAVRGRRSVWEADRDGDDLVLVEGGKPKPHRLPGLDRQLSEDARQVLSLSRALNSGTVELLGVVLPQHGATAAAPLLARASELRAEATRLRAGAEEVEEQAERADLLAGLLVRGRGGVPADDPAVTLQTAVLPSSMRVE